MVFPYGGSSAVSFVVVRGCVRLFPRFPVLYFDLCFLKVERVVGFVVLSPCRELSGSVC